MRVRIVDGTVATGADGNARSVAVGQVLDLSDHEAKELIRLGRAVAVVETPAVEPEEATDTAAETALEAARSRSGRKAGR
jgi:hypothetical protein